MSVKIWWFPLITSSIGLLLCCYSAGTAISNGKILGLLIAIAGILVNGGIFMLAIAIIRKGKSERD